MASKKVDELKVGEVINAVAARGDISYTTWSKITKLDPHRVYNANSPGKQKVITMITFKPMKGPLKDEELFFYLDDEMKVSIPPKPSKFRQIMNILFT